MRCLCLSCAARDGLAVNAASFVITSCCNVAFISCVCESCPLRQLQQGMKGLSNGVLFVDLGISFVDRSTHPSFTMSDGRPTCRPSGSSFGEDAASSGVAQ